MGFPLLSIGASGLSVATQYHFGECSIRMRHRSEWYWACYFAVAHFLGLPGVIFDLAYL